MSLLDTASLIVTPNGYKEGKLYSVIPSDGSGDMSVTRATTATRVNSQGLVELVPYNLLSYSEQIDNGYWSKYQSTITANATTAPNGTLTADRLNQTGSFSGNFFVTPSAFNGGLVSLSCFYKKGIGNVGWLEINRGAESCFIQFNLDTQVISASGYYASTNIESVGNGWYRCSVVSNQSAGTANYVGFGNIGNNGDTIFAWGAQLNEGTLKDYQKTETRLNIPRLDYSNGTCPSLLVEPQRTNIATYSSSFDNASWTKSNVSVAANNTTSPDGTQNADKITEDSASNSYHRVLQTYPFTGTANASYSFSVYVKKITNQPTRHIYWMCQNSSDGIYVHFNMTNYSVNQVGSNGTGSNASASITDVGDGWYRLTLSGIVSNVTADYYNQFYFEESVSTGFNPIPYTGNGTSGFYLWGWQIESGSYPTSYIPTTSASVTRNADVISKTGISSLIGQTEGTIFCELDRIEGAENMGIWMRTGITSYNEMITILINPDGTSVASVRSSATQQYYASSTALSSGKHKFALAYKANDFAFYIDGVQISTSTSGTPPTCDQVYLGGYPDGGVRASKNVATALWQTRLDNATLATLTTL